MTCKVSWKKKDQMQQARTLSKSFSHFSQIEISEFVTSEKQHLITVKAIEMCAKIGKWFYFFLFYQLYVYMTLRHRRAPLFDEKKKINFTRIPFECLQRWQRWISSYVDWRSSLTIINYSVYILGWISQPFANLWKIRKRFWWPLYNIYCTSKYSSSRIGKKGKNIWRFTHRTSCCKYEISSKSAHTSARTETKPQSLRPWKINLKIRWKKEKLFWFKDTQGPVNLYQKTYLPRWQNLYYKTKMCVCLYVRTPLDRQQVMICPKNYFGK